MLLPLDICLVFFAASMALAIAPGPDNIFVLTQSALHGVKAGLLITLGLCTGLFVHIGAVALGVAALFHTSALAFTALKTIGAAYLAYLAWQAFRAGTVSLDNAQNSPASNGALYIRGIIMNVTNPKVALFFLAFLPQFTDPARGSVPLQIVLLGFIFMLAAFPVFGAVAWGADRIGQWLKTSRRAQLAINRGAGVVFLLLACRLVLSKQ